MELSPKVSWFLKYLSIFFTIPIIGTLAHELGHYLVAVIYQQPARIAYSYTDFVGPNILTPEQWFWFIMGGPISTWTVAAIGIGVILGKYRAMHSELTNPIGLGQSLATVGASFSLRFIFNAGVYFISTTLLGNSSNADEVKIAQILGISPDLMMYGSAVIALFLVLVALYYLPRHQRYLILIGAIIGGILGYLFWYYWIGPILLP